MAIGCVSACVNARAVGLALGRPSGHLRRAVMSGHILQCQSDASAMLCRSIAVENYETRCIAVQLSCTPPYVIN